MKKATPFVLLLMLVGCKGRLNQEMTVELDLLEPKAFKVDPIKTEQTINVSAKANSGMFSIYIFLEKNQNAAEAEITKNKPGDKILAHDEKKTEAELKATIPANETAVVWVISGDRKKAEVKLKITN